MSIDGLGASLDQTLWVVSGYALVLAVLLITAGRLGDLFGPRSLFAAGLVVFTLASVACGLAPDPALLIAARAVQGLGAALFVPQTMTLIVSVFPARRRGAAMGIWGMVAGLATLSGPALGGILVSTVGWRWIFLVNVPIGLAALALTFLVVPDIRHSREHRFDVMGVLIATAALFCLAFGLQEGERYHWGPGIWALLAAGASLVACFLLNQRGKQDQEPLVPFALFRDRNFTGMTVLVALVSMAVDRTGAAVQPLSAVGTAHERDQGRNGATPVLAGVDGRRAVRGTARGPHRRRIPADGRTDAVRNRDARDRADRGSGHPLYAFIPATVVTGLGIGCVVAPMSTEAMRNVEPRLAGAASGVNNTIHQIGSVIGAATVGALLQGRLAAELATDKTYADAFIAAMHVTSILPIAVVLAGALACLLVRNHTRAKPADLVPAVAIRETMPGR